MPIIGLQRQMRELGRMRTGNQVASGNGRSRPNKLATMRFTSESRELIVAAAKVYGGEVVPWDNNGHAEFEVISTAAAVDIVVPPGQPVVQWMELWSGGGCLRRCDSETEMLSGTPCGSAGTSIGDGKVIPPCSQVIAERVAAAQKGRACKTTTRLNVILPQLPGLGVWRLETHGFFAAVHLAGAAEVLARATELGRLIPARLRLVEDSKKVPGEATRKWFEPVIEMVDTYFGELGITGLTPGGGPALGAGAPATARQIGPGTTSGRPDLPSTTLPETSSFRAPNPPPAAGADASTAAQGDVLDPDDPDAAPEKAADATKRARMTVAELNAALKEAGIDHQAAIERSKGLFPRPTGVPLTDEQRAALFADMTAPAAQL